MYCYEYPRPALTADCLVTNAAGELLLVLRGHDPYKGCWALPGGFMDMDETLEHCAVRELAEETGLQVDEASLRLVGVFSRPDRDPRWRTVTAAFACRSEGIAPRAGDDADMAKWWPLTALPPLAFDHREVVETFLSQTQNNIHGATL